MKNIIVDCTHIQTPLQLHQSLSAALAFPQWYGNNLDALYDCLTELGQPLHLILQSLPQEAPWAAGFLSVFADATRDNPYFSFAMTNPC